MGLDIHLEADSRLATSEIARILEKIGAHNIELTERSVDAYFESGLSVSATKSSDAAIYAEEAKGLSFPVATRCYFRVKGPEPEGLSPLRDLELFLRRISAECEAHFLVSFQYESLMYWRDGSGLHVA
ncbi:hypothetical protein IB234_23230 [Pseudomonas sp. PDM16]|uniref:hypothetical protein n=1 Tax=Pseudomonas sp. PDM16 TaxID=2769292 RepID=UPI001780ADD7|nr:hypothetical protein [Pseudomonas sp. PDM16]MBD9417488.1 hypothetical protein [Pseudomonas sp. PDM16]